MVTIYTKSYCPYCVQAKSLLKSLEIPFNEVDITNSPEMMAEIHERSGLMTVPQIFKDDKCLGGYTDIAKLHNEGKLIDLLK